MKYWIIVASFVLVGCGVSADSEGGIPVGGVGAYTVGDANPGGAPDAVASDAEADDVQAAWDVAEDAGSSPPDVTASDITASDITGERTQDAAANQDTAAPDPDLADVESPQADAAVEAEVATTPDPIAYEPCAPEHLEVDTDGDGLSDCDELSDALEATDPTRFNGLTATIGVPPEGFLSSAQCGLFFGTDFGELDQHFTPSNQAMSIISGWEYSAGNTAEYGDASQFDFEPNWEDSDNVGIWDSFQILYTGWLHLEQASTYCFSVDTGAGGFGPGDIAGRRNNCGLFYVNPEPATAPLAETGYGSNESPHTGCAEYEEGWHRVALAARHYETYFYSPKLSIRWCQSEAESCTPTTPLAQHQMQSDAEATPLPEFVFTEPEGGTEGGDGEGTPDAVTEPPSDVAQGEDVGPEVQEGACTNPEDNDLIDALGEGGLEQGITDCGMPCFFDGDKLGCITDCIASDMGLSEACATCYAVPAACAMANCVSECLDGGADCEQCMDDNGCQDDFSTCSGLDG